MNTQGWFGTISKDGWETIEKPGWFGERKRNALAEYDRLYGQGNWRIRHRLGSRLIDFSEAVRIYELCYELHFLNPHSRYLWLQLFKEARDVWTELESDVESGTDYLIQKAPAPHYEDIAIRIILQRYDRKFTGNKMIRVRADSPDVIGVALSSIHIPFILPDFIEPEAHGVQWWNRHRGSLEHFWHANKELQIRRKK
ncbi:MAG: hypothetical protein PHC97_00015 [Patescibacteria group bacterium]|nr:hypothetical protein [Patescibacteria group bacterium]